jgi:uncharacterized membrane protein YeiH
VPFACTHNRWTALGFAATISAFNGALLIRRPATTVTSPSSGLLIALLGGLARDVLLNKIPGALTSPAYIPCA